MSNKYWKSEDELLKDPKFLADQKNEFPTDFPLEEVLNENDFELNSSRRDFLKFFGFSVSAVALAACNTAPIRKAIPYLVKPEEIIPGVPLYYHSTCGICSTACGVEVKTREGRPIKIDGNYESKISQGGLCARGQAGIGSLYDIERPANPSKGGVEITDWTKIDAEISQGLASASGRIALVTGTIHSPSALKAIADFKTKYPNTDHITYDAVSYTGIIEANRSSFGKAAIPGYNFDQALAIVSFGADFLGTWISPVEFSKQYVKNRVPADGKEMSRHIQFESTMSITGTNADDRFPMKASKEGAYVATLYNYLVEKAGAGKQIPLTKSAELAGNSLKMAAEVLWANKGKSLVISGSNDPKVQTLINGINILLENYGKTIDLTNHSNQYKGIDDEFEKFVTYLNAGTYGAVIFHNANPVYNHSRSAEIQAGIKKAKLSVSLAQSKDETAAVCTYHCPNNHYLESWGDAEPRAGQYHFIQPVISQVFNTRQAEVSLLTWAGALPAAEKDPMEGKQILNQKFHTSPYYTYMQNNWMAVLGADGFMDKFNSCLHNGIYSVTATETAVPAFSADLSLLASDLEAAGNDSGVDMVLYQSVGMGDGSEANNPWMYELPDPVSKVSWDNYVAISKAMSVHKGIKEGDLVNIKAGNVTLNNVPVVIQPGQANNTIAMAVGFGHTSSGKVTNHEGKPVGVNAYPAMSYNRGARLNVVSNVTVTKASGSYELARTQTHHSIEGRNHVRETSLTNYKKDKTSGNKPGQEIYTLWTKKDYAKDGSPNHLWAMAIDLNACTGCSSCIVSCSMENNVPVVGRTEIRRRREMHWIRIDRYYSFANVEKYNAKGGEHFEGNFVTKEKGLAALDNAMSAEGANAQYQHWENVRVVHQPLMCQHCQQAPCETVCPVLATTHSTEGLNQMTYNRCIGTKYCGNNCPYKVRRFNWFRYNDNDNFDFHYNNKLGKMVINPDVTVRTRGVMEKCSFCVQKIQEGKLTAKRENRKVKDHEVKTACMRTCPANAIVFGDLHDENSEVAKLFKNERTFSVLEELNTQNQVKYLTKIRNTENV